MGKIVLFLLAAIAGWLLVKSISATRRVGKAEKTSPPPAERMVKCHVCGVFMPESDSMQRDGQLTCRVPDRCLHRQSSR